MNQNCPCGKNTSLENCCLPIIKGEKKAKTAEELMRSRYTAYTLADIDYIMKTHHHTSRPLSEYVEIQKWAKRVKWLKLEVLKTKKGTETDTEGFVEFKAHFKELFKKKIIHENSYFVKENEEWFYVSGTHH
ncbi:YchJ family protein [Aureivirga sp. CE67]|uniref:YchJ family protein n=1 Tax=Aureivirga sp. CE67 TaxID=1788983 RepID=UPI0018C9D043|nr:YchJ family metal-binding protein [Aureivirga sp. CE67]